MVDAPVASDRAADVARRLADFERLRLPLRMTVRQTPDGLGIDIPPQRNPFIIGFMLLWLAGWAAGALFGLGEVSSLSMPGILVLVWLIPWTLAGLFALRFLVWQLFGREQLFFTAGALVRERRMPWLNRRRVVMGSDIRKVTADAPDRDVFGLGTVRVEMDGGSLRIGSGLGRHESELVADLIREHAAG